MTSTDKELRERFERDLSDFGLDFKIVHEGRYFYRDTTLAWEGYRAGHAEARAEIEALKCRIDNLMFEYCPEDMTPEQIEKWGKRQRRVSAEETALIDAAMASEPEPSGGAL